MTYDPNQTTVLPQYPVTEELPITGPPGGDGPTGRLFLKILAGLLIAALAATATILIINSQRTHSVAPGETTEPTPAANAGGEAPAPPTVTELDDDLPGYWQVVGVPDGVNVRSGPGTDNEVVGGLQVGDRHIFSNGERATVDGAEWRQVQLGGGQTGWVVARFLAADTAPDENAPPPTAVPAPVEGGRNAVVCFQDADRGNRVAQLQFTNTTEITGVVRTINGQSAPRDQTVTGTLDNGRATVMLTRVSNGQTETADWAFGPADLDLGDGTSLRVVDCNVIANLLS